ncbi:MAG: site-specific DNA-methyltransferase [Thermoplasmata archaeon]|nr:site-specific DNA-methyltransferase [Thermoplasmata archaeon]
MTRPPRTPQSSVRGLVPGGSSPVLDLIVHGDALQVLRRLPSGSVHLAITSPPYNVGIAYQGYSDDRTQRGYLDWLGTVWRELHRVLVEGGRFALNVAPTSIKDFRPIHHDLSHDLRRSGFIMRTEIIWYKQTMGRRTAWGSWRSPANPHIIPSWEYVLVFSKGSWRLDGDRAKVDISAKEFQDYSDGHWFIRPERRRHGHPAPFPEELIQRLVKFYSYRENLVLDMFGGTGTVAAVARQLGRHFLHVDASLEYCQVALARVRAGSTPEGPAGIPPPDRVWEAESIPTGPRRSRRVKPAQPGAV